MYFNVQHRYTSSSINPSSTILISNNPMQRQLVSLDSVVLHFMLLLVTSRVPVDCQLTFIQNSEVRGIIRYTSKVVDKMNCEDFVQILWICSQSLQVWRRPHAQAALVSTMEHVNILTTLTYVNVSLDSTIPTANKVH